MKKLPIFLISSFLTSATFAMEILEDGAPIPATRDYSVRVLSADDVVEITSSINQILPFLSDARNVRHFFIKDKMIRNIDELLDFTKSFFIFSCGENYKEAFFFMLRTAQVKCYEYQIEKEKNLDRLEALKREVAGVADLQTKISERTEIHPDMLKSSYFNIRSAFCAFLNNPRVKSNIRLYADVSTTICNFLETDGQRLIGLFPADDRAVFQEQMYPILYECYDVTSTLLGRNKVKAKDVEMLLRRQSSEAWASRALDVIKGMKALKYAEAERNAKAQRFSKQSRLSKGVLKVAERGLNHEFLGVRASVSKVAAVKMPHLNDRLTALSQNITDSVLTGDFSEAVAASALLEQALRTGMDLEGRAAPNLADLYFFFFERTDLAVCLKLLKHNMGLFCNFGDFSRAKEYRNVYSSLCDVQDEYLESMDAFIELGLGNFEPFQALEAKAQQAKEANAQLRKGRKRQSQQAFVSKAREAVAASERMSLENAVSVSAAPQVLRRVTLQQDPALGRSEGPIALDSAGLKRLRHEEAERARQESAMAAGRAEADVGNDDEPALPVTTTPTVEELPFSLIDLYGLTGKSATLDGKIESGNFNFSRRDFRTYLTNLGCEQRSGRGSHEVVNFSGLQIFERNGQLVFMDGFQGFLTLPEWSGTDVPIYLRKQISGARKVLKAIKERENATA